MSFYPSRAFKVMTTKILHKNGAFFPPAMLYRNYNLIPPRYFRASFISSTRNKYFESQSGSDEENVSITDSSPFSSEYHTPVMCKEVLEWLISDPDGVYLDCTLGGGGHSAAILAGLKNGQGRLIGLDQDPDALEFATKRLEKDIEEGRFRALQANFRDATEILKQEGAIPGEGFSGMLLDLGISSHQIDEPSRGFSFRTDGPLDMRMQGPASSGLSAHGIVNDWEVGDLTKLLKEYGEEPRAYKIARAIVASRPLTTTMSLKDVVEKQVPFQSRAKTLARVFQALRIAVNGEMEALESILMQSTKLMKPEGRLVVLSYHSLEDRPVKRFMKTGNLKGKENKDFFGNSLSTWKPLTRSSLRPSEEEVNVNARSRSVSMRVAERTHISEAEIRHQIHAPPPSSPEEVEELWAKEKKKQKQIPRPRN